MCTYSSQYASPNIGALRELTFGAQVVPKTSILHPTVEVDRLLVTTEAWCKDAHALDGGHDSGGGNESGRRIDASHAFENCLPRILRGDRNGVEGSHFSHLRNVEYVLADLLMPGCVVVVS